MTEPRINSFDQPIGEPLPDWSPRPAPRGEVLRGRYCRLEPLTMQQSEALYAALSRDQSGRQWTYMPYGPFTHAEEFTDLVGQLLEDPALVVFAVVDFTTEQVEGMASYGRIDPAIGSTEVGHVMYSPPLQRAPAATEAMYLLARHVFDDLGYRRYEWKCDALNAGSLAAAQRLGFAYEGTWRNATIYKGRNRDTAWFAMTDSDWSVLRPVIEAWLDPANFAEGRQRSSLSEATAHARTRLDSPPQGRLP